MSGRKCNKLLSRIETTTTDRRDVTRGKVEEEEVKEAPQTSITRIVLSCAADAAAGHNIMIINYRASSEDMEISSESDRTIF